MSDADGTHLVQLSNFKNALTGTPRWSPDSKKIAFDSRESGHPEVYVVDISERVPRMLVTKISEAMMPSWSHDGEWIYFVSGGTAGQKLYRCPISGGDAVLLSEAGGWYPLESLDGETVYFPSSADRNVLNALSLKHPSAESPLEGMPRVATYNMWTVGPGGIYFARAEAPQSVCYFDFATKKSHLLFEAAKPFWPSLSVSSDGRWILYSQWDEDNADIMLVDHFR